MVTHFDKKVKRLCAKKRGGNCNDAYFRKVGSQKVVMWVMFTIFAAYVLTLIYPFAWLLVNSFKKVEAFIQNPNSVFFVPTFGNYLSGLRQRSALGDTSILGMLGNSFLIAGVGTLLTVVTSSCAAYIMAKFEFKGHALIFGIVIFSMILPIVGTLPALLRVMKQAGLYNTYPVLFFLYSGGLGNNFILLYSFFKNISWQYAEAAYIDGAGDLKVFVRIMVPLALPAVTSIAVLTFIGLWGEYAMPRVLLPGRPTIAVGLFEISEKFKNNDRPVLFSAVMIAIVPMIAVFAAFQKTIMTNTVAGGLKG